MVFINSFKLPHSATLQAGQAKSGFANQSKAKTWEPGKTKETTKGKEKMNSPAQRQNSPLNFLFVCLFYWGPQQLGWSPLTLVKVIYSENTLTDIHRNNVIPVTWASLSSVMLTKESNHTGRFPLVHFLAGLDWLLSFPFHLALNAPANWTTTPTMDSLLHQFPNCPLCKNPTSCRRHLLV